MTRTSALRRLAPAVAVLAALGLAAPAAQASDTPAPEHQKALDALKAAHDKYKDPAVAVADGYMATDECAVNPADGSVMGYHYVNPKLVAAPVDQNKPPVIIYQPDGNGGRKLVAVEYFKPDADQNLATSDDKPTLFGRPFDGPMEGHSPDMPKHYDMHVWLWQNNPDGVLADWNPAGSCKGATPMSHDMGGGQVTKTPSGGAQTGGVRPIGGEDSNLWLYGLGGAAMAAGVVVLRTNRRTRRSEG
jgi:hypothetical protein